MATMNLSTREGRHEQGKLIQQAAEAAGLSLDELARAINCSRALIYQYVSGATLAQPDRVQQIAHHTGQTLAHFYGGDTTPEEVREEMAKLEEERRGLAAEREAFRQRHLQETATALHELARAQAEPPDPRALASTCEQLTSLLRELGAPILESEALVRLGNARLQLSDLEGARRALERAVDVAHRVGDLVQELSARQSLGHTLLSLGHVEAALTEFRAVATSDDWWHRWQGALSIGAVHEMTGSHAEALEQLERVERILEEAPDPDARSTAHVYLSANLANVYLSEGEFPTAARLAAEALTGAEQVGLRDQYIEGYINTGVCTQALGDLPGALASLRRAAAFARCTGDTEREAVATACLSRVLSALGQHDRARDAGRDAAREALRVGSRRAELLAETALAEAHEGSGMARDALYHAARALEVARATRVRRSEADLLAAHGRCRQLLGDTEAARADSMAALTLAQEVSARPAEVNAHLLAGRLALSAVDAATAGEHAGQAAILSAAMQASELLRRSRTLDGLALIQAGKPAEAVQPLRAAVAAIEEMRRQVRAAGLDDALLEDAERREAYVGLARALAATGHPTDARAVGEDAGWPPLRDAVVALLAEEM